ncbi:caspase family protein [Larkinella arboricola]
MNKWLLCLLFGLISPGIVWAQHLGMAQLMELFNASTDRRGVILKANDFEYQGVSTVPGTTCFRYSRIQPDVYGDEHEESVTYCTTRSLSYVTYSPDHATNLKFQVLRKFGFEDRGAFTSPAGLLKNLYQRRNLKIETANLKNEKRQEMWVFQIYEETVLVPPKDTTTLLVQQKNDASVDPAGPVLKGNFYALLIGVNDYHDRRLPDLTFPIQDAMKLKRVLTDRYKFNDRNITFLSNPTRKGILRAFDEMTYRLRKDDNLLIFFAGHGRQDEKSQQGYWLPADAQNDYNDDWLSNSTIRDQVRRFTCQHVLVVSDACFSGELISNRSGGAPKAIQQLYRLPSRRAITSSGNTVVPDRSVFIHYLVQRLTENEKAYLTANELFVTMREAVINNSPLAQVPMYGYIQQTGDEGGDFIFIRKTD